MINPFLIPRKRSNVTFVVYHIGIFFSSGMNYEDKKAATKIEYPKIVMEIHEIYG